MSIQGKRAKEERALIAENTTHDVNEYHRQLDPNEQVTRATANAFGIKLTGKFQKCGLRDRKGTPENAKKIPSKKGKHSGGRISLNISSPEYKGVSGTRHWLLFLDKHSDTYVLEPLPKTEKRSPRNFPRNWNKNKAQR